MIKLLDGEKIILVKRRHWLVIAIEGAVIFLIACVPVGATLLVYWYFPVVALAMEPYWIFIIFFLAAWVEFSWMLFFIFWTNYYLDVFLVTNKRIIDIEQISLFVRDTAELRLENIQDIKVEVVGLVQSIFKMGNLHIQTASQHKEVLFANIPGPDEVKHVISQSYDQTLKRGAGVVPNNQESV